MMPVGARLAEMARLRLRYDESRRQVQEIQQVRYVFLIKIINSKVFERKNEKISTTKISNPVLPFFISSSFSFAITFWELKQVFGK